MLEQRRSIRYTRKDAPKIHSYLFDSECDINGIWRAIVETDGKMYFPLSGAMPEYPKPGVPYKEVGVAAELLEGGVRRRGVGWWQGDKWHPPPLRNIIEGARVIAKYPPEPPAQDIVIFNEEHAESQTP